METRTLLEQSRRDNAAHALRQARWYLNNWQHDGKWTAQRVMWHMMRYAEWKTLAMENDNDR